MDQHPGLTLTSIEPDAIAAVADGSTEPGVARDAARLRGFDDAVERAFLNGRTDDDRHTRVLAHLRADRATLRGVWVDEPVLGGGDLPVATFSSFDKTINVGAGRTVPVRMITDVTVSPAYRRRGLTRHLMRTDLDDAVSRGVPVAALTASEASIYGRFGFGAATWLRKIEVDTTRFAVRADGVAAPDDGPAGGRDEGRVVVAEPADAWPAVAEVFRRWHAQTRGSLERPQFYEPELSGAYDFEAGGPAKKLRAVVHLDGAGEPDGYALYTPVGKVDGVQTVDVKDLVALGPATYLRLWRFLAEMDLVRRVRHHRARVVDPLDRALHDARAVRTVGIDDMIWLRVLDVVTALEARPWFADGVVVLDVTDALGHAAGRWRVVVRDGVADVSALADGADVGGDPLVALHADTLGTLYLGGVAVSVLDEAGRLGGTPDAVAALGRMMDGGPAPYALTGF